MKPTTELGQSETGLIYRLRRGQPHGPLIAMLHGLSGDESVMWIFDHALPREATVIAPRALYASELGGYSWAQSVVRGELDHVDYTAALSAVQSLVGEATRLYKTDPQHVIVMGFSQGAALSYVLSLTHPEMLHGVIALAGFLPQQSQHFAPSYPAHRAGDALGERAATSRIQRERRREAAESKNALPHYLIIHGTHDEAVPIARARAARSVLESRGAAVEYHEHHVGHKVSAQGMKEIARWIKQILS